MLFFFLVSFLEKIHNYSISFQCKKMVLLWKMSCEETRLCSYCGQTDVHSIVDGFLACDNCGHCSRYLDFSISKSNGDDRINFSKKNTYARSVYVIRSLKSIGLIDRSDTADIVDDYSRVESAFNRLKLLGIVVRKNILPNKFVLHKLIQKNKIHFDFTWRAKSNKTMKNLETIWEKIENELKWK